MPLLDITPGWDYIYLVSAHKGDPFTTGELRASNLNKS